MNRDEAGLPGADSEELLVGVLARLCVLQGSIDAFLVLLSGFLSDNKDFPEWLKTWFSNALSLRPRPGLAICLSNFRDCESFLRIT